jgi:hypothetical protein
LRNVTWMLALAASSAGLAAVGLAAEPPVAQPGLPEVITTRQTLFAIPFEIDQAADAARMPAEVQLHVSVDQGAHWQVYGRVAPAQRQFLFRAGADEEYWFAIVTRDRSGQLHPERPEGPGLRVLVDTTLPELKLDARQGEAGQVVLRWQITEPHLKLDTLRIQYRSDPAGSWQTVAIDRQGIRSSGPTSTGEVVWWPELRSTVIEIRAEVADTAGNAAVSHAQVRLNRVASAEPDARAVTGTDDRGSLAASTQTPASGWRASDDLGPPARQSHGPSTGSAPSGVAASVYPPVRNEYVAPDVGHVSNVPTAEQRPKMLNSRVFEIMYDVTSVDPSGVGRVELWGTRDGGRTWTSFGIDPDKESPMLVTVPEEGAYGFRVAVQNGLGLGGQKPQSGEQPDLWIGVDLTPPEARITSAGPGTGDRAGQLIIRWQARDEMPSDRPVSLFYSEAPGGPWAEIVTGLENTGEYAWSPARQAPGRIYLRLEFRDQAGNVGVFQTPEALALDSVGPHAKIGSVRPVVDSAQTRPMRYQPR